MIIFKGLLSEVQMRYTSSLISGRQLRAARALAELTQRDLAEEVGVSERSARRWERHPDKRPVGKPTNRRIEEALRKHGVLLITDPAPGCCMIK